MSDVRVIKVTRTGSDSPLTDDELLMLKLQAEIAQLKAERDALQAKWDAVVVEVGEPPVHRLGTSGSKRNADRSAYYKHKAEHLAAKLAEAQAKYTELSNQFLSIRWNFGLYQMKPAPTAEQSQPQPLPGKRCDDGACEHCEPETGCTSQKLPEKQCNNYSPLHGTKLCFNCGKHQRDHSDQTEGSES